MTKETHEDCIHRDHQQSMPKLLLRTSVPRPNKLSHGSRNTQTWHGEHGRGLLGWKGGHLLPPSRTCGHMHVKPHVPALRPTQRCTQLPTCPASSSYQCEHMPTVRPDTTAHNAPSHTVDTLVKAHTERCQGARPQMCMGHTHTHPTHQGTH